MKKTNKQTRVLSGCVVPAYYDALEKEPTSVMHLLHVATRISHRVINKAAMIA
jgi:hypothetical protein